jgi:hypothetical protein
VITVQREFRAGFKKDVILVWCIFSMARNLKDGAGSEFQRERERERERERGEGMSSLYKLGSSGSVSICKYVLPNLLMT